MYIVHYLILQIASSINQNITNFSNAPVWYVLTRTATTLPKLNI